MREGARVRFIGIGRFVRNVYLKAKNDRKFYEIHLDQLDGIKRTVWIREDAVAEISDDATEDQLSVKSNEWREIAADMIRSGRDAEAYKLLDENATQTTASHFSQLLTKLAALEAFAANFALTSNDEETWLYTQTNENCARDAFIKMRKLYKHPALP